MKRCCICKDEFSEYGNNPDPFDGLDEGEQCCDHCNTYFVVPVRLMFGRNVNNRQVLELLTKVAQRGAMIERGNKAARDLWAEHQAAKKADNVTSIRP